MARAKRRVSEAVEEAVRVLGERLATARRRRQLSQAEVAARANITRLQLSRIENGTTTAALATYVAILFALGFQAQVEAVANPDTDSVGKGWEALNLPRRIRGRYDPW